MAESFGTVIDLMRQEGARGLDLQGHVTMDKDMWANFLMRLKVAHEEEVTLFEREGYERGYDSGKHALDVETWQLDQERYQVAHRLGQIDFSDETGSHPWLAMVARAVRKPSHGWTMGACEKLRDELVRLLTGENRDEKDPETCESCGKSKICIDDGYDTYPSCACMETGQVVPVEEYRAAILRGDKLLNERNALLDLLRDAARDYQIQGDIVALQESLLVGTNEEIDRLKRRYKRLKRKLRKEKEFADALGEDCDTLLDALRERQATGYPQITLTPATVSNPAVPEPFPRVATTPLVVPSGVTWGVPPQISMEDGNA